MEAEKMMASGEIHPALLQARKCNFKVVERINMPNVDGSGGGYLEHEVNYCGLKHIHNAPYSTSDTCDGEENCILFRRLML